MTARTLAQRVAAVIAFYLCAIIALIAVRTKWSASDSIYYNTFKDLIPLIIATPAAYLGVCFQRRANYVSQLRALWSKTVSAVQTAFQYTHAGGVAHDAKYGSPFPTQEQFGDTLRQISTVIDEIRGVYRNVGAHGGDIGLYPFESLKEIHGIVSGLGFGEQFASDKAAMARAAIRQRWDVLKETMTREFERDNPTFVETGYLVRTHRVRNVRDAFDPNRFTYEVSDGGG